MKGVVAGIRDSDRAEHQRERPAPFLVGSPRSGTTLLRLMLDAHPELAIPPETGFLMPILEAGAESPAASTSVGFWTAVTTYRSWPDFRMDVEAFRRAVESGGAFTLRRGLRAFYETYAARFGKRRWGDKTPFYVHWMPQIQALLPEAHFIHIIRDGRDVAISRRGLWIDPGTQAARARAWLKDVRAGRDAARELRHYLEIRFEDLIREPQKMLDRVSAYLHLPFLPEMLDYHLGAANRLQELSDRFAPDGSLITTRDAHIAIHALVTQPPQESRIGRWQTELSAAEIADFEAVAGPLLCELGYTLGGSGLRGHG